MIRNWFNKFPPGCTLTVQRGRHTLTSFKLHRSKRMRCPRSVWMQPPSFNAAIATGNWTGFAPIISESADTIAPIPKNTMNMTPFTDSVHNCTYRHPSHTLTTFATHTVDASTIVLHGDYVGLHLDIIVLNHVSAKYYFSYVLSYV